VAYTVEDLLNVLHPQCPVKADALCKNRRNAIASDLPRLLKPFRQSELSASLADLARTASN